MWASLDSYDTNKSVWNQLQRHHRYIHTVRLLMNFYIRDVYRDKFSFISSWVSPALTLLPALQTDSAPHSFQRGMLQDELTSPSGNIDCLYNKEAAVFTCPQCEAASSGSDFERLRRAARLEKQQRPDYLGGGQWQVRCCLLVGRRKCALSYPINQIQRPINPLRNSAAATSFKILL